MEKIKRFKVERVPCEIKYRNKALGRLWLFLNFWRFIKFARVQPTIFGYDACKPIFRVYIAKFKKVGG